MSEKVLADASPEKRLFISLLTRDIPMVAAFLDLVDNSINAAVEPIADRLKTAEDYLIVSNDEAIKPTVDIRISVAEHGILVEDTAPGIPLKTAQENVFKFGPSDGENHSSDRLSVYGIGLKRAMFKLGNRIRIRSDHELGGFDLDLTVSKWARLKQYPWKFEITTREPAPKDECGTRIHITELYDDVKRRVSDGVLMGTSRRRYQGPTRFIRRDLSTFMSRVQRLMAQMWP